MKPTKETIELAKKLHELGYPQKIKQGNWYIVPKDISYSSKQYLVIAADNEPDQDVRLIPIPPLEDGLMWLNKHSNTKGIQWAVMLLNNVSTNKKWSCHFNPDIGKYCEADTPREAVFKAMIKVLEK